MSTTLNNYVERRAVTADETIDIIDVTIRGDRVEDWHYRPYDDLGILEEVEAARAVWLSNNDEPAYVFPLELMARNARFERLAFLKETDYVELPHISFKEGEKEAWQEYRQALRDIPEQEGFPKTIVWPDRPNV